MSGPVGVALGLAVGLALGVLVGWLALRRRSPEAPAGNGNSGEPALATARLQEAVLERAPIAVLTLSSDDDVLLANRRARDLGLLARRRLVEPLLEIARHGRQRGEATADLQLSTAALPHPLQVRVVATRLPDRVVALMVEDITEAHRVNLVRRDFVANVSHEIKTPVGAIRLLADAALESLSEMPDPEQARHFVSRISHESARLGRLVSELLDLSRLQGAEARPDPVPVGLDDVVGEAVDRAQLHADAKGIALVRGPASGAVVPGVEPQLVTAVANLLDNAINYSPEGTRVALAIRRAGAGWEITVTDQGVGIPEGDLDRIFERFYRVDPARSRATGGTGLGLAIVKHIVRNHGGEVRVWSSPGAGSSFTIRLPAELGSPVTDVSPEEFDAAEADQASSSPAVPPSARKQSPVNGASVRGGR